MTLLTLLLHFGLTLLSVHAGFSYFRDEFYYIMCGRRLAWGYVDHGPLVAVQARVGEKLFGDSVFSIRVLSAFGRALAVGLTGLLTASFGGRKPSQLLAMLCLLSSAIYLAIGSFLSMNSWEPVFWTLLVLGIRLLWLGAEPRAVWVALGLTIGLGLLNKPSLLFFLACIFVGLLLTPERRLLLNRWAVVAVLLASLLALPFVHWQVSHGMAMLEFLQRGSKYGKNIVLAPWSFISAQLLGIGPLSALVWILGVVCLLRERTVFGGRAFGIAAVFFFPLMFFMHAKDYYLAPIYPMLFAAGAVAVFTWAASPVRRRAVLVFEALIVATGALVLPVAVPILRPDTFLAYATTMHLPKPPIDNMDTGPLPQLFADHFGWQQEFDMVTAALSRMPADQRSRVAILTENYGEAASLEFFGHNMPPVVSGHNNYYIWGPRGQHNGPLIVIDHYPISQYQRTCRSVQVLGTLSDPWAMPYEHKTIYLVDGCSRDLTRDWAGEKHYI